MYLLRTCKGIILESNIFGDTSSISREMLKFIDISLTFYLYVEMYILCLCFHLIYFFDLNIHFEFSH